jgi:uncharacterized protein
MSPAPPVGPAERIEVIDALRGFAIFGILLMNVQVFSGTYFHNLLGTTPTYALPRMDALLDAAVSVFVVGKFYALFSLLFGIGFAMQAHRAARAGRSFSLFFRKRMGILLLIGLAHTFLLWSGDILATYALLGFVLVFFRRSSGRVILGVAAVMLALPVLQYAALMFVAGPLPTSPVAAPEVQGAIAAFMTATAEGGYPTVLLANLTLFLEGRLPDLLFTGRFFTIPGLFLLGHYIGRRWIAQGAMPDVRTLRIAGAWGIGLGVPLNLLYVWLNGSGAYALLTPLGLAQSALYATGVPLLCIGYAAGFVLLYQHAGVRPVLLSMVPVGRMALTNYLGQSVLCALVFFGYGLGLHGKLGLTYALAIAMGVMAVQLIGSAVWMNVYRFGPVEWIWRNISYGSRQPLRKPQSIPA